MFLLLWKVVTRLGSRYECSGMLRCWLEYALGRSLCCVACWCGRFRGLPIRARSDIHPIVSFRVPVVYSIWCVLFVGAPSSVFGLSPLGVDMVLCIHHGLTSLLYTESVLLIQLCCPPTRTSVIVLVELHLDALGYTFQKCLVLRLRDTHMWT